MGGEWLKIAVRGRKGGEGFKRLSFIKHTYPPYNKKDKQCYNKGIELHLIRVLSPI